MMSVDQFMRQDTIYAPVRFDESRTERARSTTSANISDDEADMVYGLNEWGEGLSEMR